MSSAATSVQTSQPVPVTRVFAKAIQVLKESGPVEGTGLLTSHCLDRLADRWYGVSTSKISILGEEGIHDDHLVSYAPIDYFSVWFMLQRLDIAEEDVFVDFGAGRGRALLVAARQKFASVIGVELDPKLAECARKNVELAGSRLRCKEVSISQGNAVDFEIPPEATVLHFFHPFYGEPLELVAQNIVESLRQHPRKLTILFANPFDFERIVHQTNILPRAWLKSQSCHRWPLYRTDGIGNLYRDYRFDSR